MPLAFAMKTVQQRLRTVSRFVGGSGRILRIANAFLVALLLSTILPARPAFAQDTPPSTYTFQECEQIEEARLRDELNRITQEVFAEEQGRLDLTTLVKDKWDETGMDAAVDSTVRAAVANVRRETPWWELIQSNWHAATAKRLATRVAARAFGSKSFRASFDRLSEEIADELNSEIHVITVKSASSALLCVEEFIGESFSQTMAEVLKSQILAKVDVTGDDLDTEARDFVEVLEQHPNLLSGVAVIVVTQIAKQLAQKMAGTIIGQVATRVLGKVVASAIPLVGWIIGGVLIVWDVINAREGALPQIEKSLQEENAKASIREKITIEVSGVMEEEFPRLGRSIADDVFSLWRGFRVRHDRVLELAEANPSFRSILDYSTVGDVEKLAELLAVADATLQPEKLAEMIRTGQFERIFSLPVEAYAILSVGEVRDEVWDPVELVLAWAELAGEEDDNIIVGVVKTELYQIALPSEFNERETLERVLDLEEPIAIKELMRLSEAKRAALLRLTTAQTKWTLTVLTAEEIDWVVAYLLELPTQVQGGLVDYVMRERGLIPKLQESEELRAKFPGVLTLANTNARVKAVLNDTGAEEAEKLSELVAVVSEALVPEQLIAMIDSGQFEKILALPQTAFAILRENRDSGSVLAWAEIAGDAIVRVVETELYRVATPAEFRDRDEVERVLTLRDPTAMQKLMMLAPEERNVFLGLATEKVLALLRLSELPAETLPGLAAYLPDLSPQATDLLIDFALQEPGLIFRLQESEDLWTKFPRVLALAQENQVFRSILDNTPAASVEKLSNLVNAADSTLTQEQLDKMIESDQFERILALPQQAFAILRVSEVGGDVWEPPELALAWAELAGERRVEIIVRIVETELYRLVSPSQFNDGDELEKVLALQDAEAAQILMRLSQEERDALLELPTELTQSALSALSPEDLAWLASYLPERPRDERVPLVNDILREPELMSTLKSSSEPGSLTANGSEPPLLPYLLIVLAGLIILFWVGRRILARNRKPEVATDPKLPERRDRDKDRP